MKCSGQVSSARQILQKWVYFARRCSCFSASNCSRRSSAAGHILESVFHVVDHDMNSCYQQLSAGRLSQGVLNLYLNRVDRTVCYHVRRVGMLAWDAHESVEPQ